MEASLDTSCALSQLGPFVFSAIALGVKLPVSILYVPGPKSLFCVWVCASVHDDGEIGWTCNTLGQTSISSNIYHSSMASNDLSIKCYTLNM